MKKNVGNADRIIRIIIAILFAVLYFTNVVSGTTGIILLVLAGVLLVTALVVSCGLYTLFGISTCKVEKKQ